MQERHVTIKAIYGLPLTHF